jgi:hypothetical protein
MDAAQPICGNGSKLGLKVSNPNLQEDAPPASSPQTPPPTDIGHGHPQYHFTQGLLELQKSFVKTEAALAALSANVDAMNKKIDDLMDWKAKIVGGTFAVLLIIGAIWAIIVFGSDYYTLTPKS